MGRCHSTCLEVRGYLKLSCFLLPREGQTQVFFPSEPSRPCLRFSTSLLLSFYFPEIRSDPLVQKHNSTLSPFFL